MLHNPRPTKDSVKRRPKLVRQSRQEFILEKARTFGSRSGGTLSLEQIVALRFRPLQIGNVRSCRCEKYDAARLIFYWKND